MHDGCRSVELWLYDHHDTRLRDAPRRVERHRRRGDGPRARGNPSRRPGESRRTGRGVHPPADQAAAVPGARGPTGTGDEPETWSLVGRHRSAQSREDPGQHGDRAQRPARPVGLDARSQDPLLDVGVGPRLARGAVEARPQRDPSHLHQHPRPRQRPRLRDHAGRRAAAVAAALPRPAGLELRDRLHLRVRHRHVRPRPRRPHPRQAEDVAGEEGRGPGDPGQGPPPADQGLRALPGARGPRLAFDDRSERHRQPGPQPVEPLDHHVRPLPRGRLDLRAGGARRGRDPRRAGTCGRCSVRPTSPAPASCT